MQASLSTLHRWDEASTPPDPVTCQGYGRQQPQHLESYSAHISTALPSIPKAAGTDVEGGATGVRLKIACSVERELSDIVCNSLSDGPVSPSGYRYICVQRYTLQRDTLVTVE